MNSPQKKEPQSTPETGEKSVRSGQSLLQSDESGHVTRSTSPVEGLAIDLASIQQHHSVLDIACGTGDLTLDILKTSTNQW